MASVLDAAGNPIPTSAVLMSASNHIGVRCHAENVEFLKCKRKDQNPEKCLDKGRDVTRCVLGLLKDLHQKCTEEMDDYVGCMYYHTNEFDLCLKEQEAFEKKNVPWNERMHCSLLKIITLVIWSEQMQPCHKYSLIMCLYESLSSTMLVI